MQLNVLENFQPHVPKEFRDSEFLMLGNLMPSIQKMVLQQMGKKTKTYCLGYNEFLDGPLYERLKRGVKRC